MSFKPETIENVLARFPEQARQLVREHFEQYHFRFKITKPKLSRLGSFRGVRHGSGQIIQINSDLGPFTFLLVFLHELAHLVIMKQYGRRVKPHGQEWKNAYRILVQPCFEQHIFPSELEAELKRYFIKTPATFHRDTHLINTLASVEGGVAILTLNDVPANTAFTLTNGRQFVKLEKLRTRYKCYCPRTKKYFLVSKSAQVLLP